MNALQYFCMEDQSMLKEPVQIKNVTLKNRLVMPPMATYKTAGDGKVTKDILDYYNTRAEGGKIGLIITEHGYICRQGKAGEKQISFADDADLNSLKKLVEVLHQCGSKAIAQLNHAGSAASAAVTGERPVSASSMILPVTPPMGDGSIPAELTAEQIADIVQAFADAAVRAKEAGYDGVEIHSAHAYLLNQFYSPLTNQRTDAYGGSLDNRLRIHRETIAAVRAAVGPDYPVAVRLGGCDYMEGGSTIEDSVYASRVFEEAGIDLIDLSGGMCRFTRPGHEEAGYFKDMSAAVKAAVNVPVILTGGVKTAEEAEQLLAEGAADLIGVGRELLKNPKWADENL